MKNYKIKTNQHRDHLKWVSIIGFYQEEIRIFLNQLKELQKTEPTNFSILEHTQEYDQILRVKLERLTQLKDQIASHEKELTLNNPINPSELLDHRAIEQALQTFIHKFESLKKNFRRFVSRH